MDGFETYLLLLPSGVGGHDRHPDRLRALAELHGYDGWLLGCRDHGRRNGRRRVVVTPLMAVGTPAGMIGAALTAAGRLHGCDTSLPRRRPTRPDPPCRARPIPCTNASAPPSTRPGAPPRWACG